MPHIKPILLLLLLTLNLTANTPLLNHSTNAVNTYYAYDSRNRVISIEHKNSSNTLLQSFIYTLDAIGNKTQIVELSARTVNYEYNSVNYNVPLCQDQ